MTIHSKVLLLFWDLIIAHTHKTESVVTKRSGDCNWSSDLTFRPLWEIFKPLQNYIQIIQLGLYRGNRIITPTKET